MSLTIRICFVATILATTLLAQPASYSLKTESNCGVYNTFKGAVHSKAWISSNWNVPWGRSYKRDAHGAFTVASIYIHGRTQTGGWPQAYLSAHGRVTSPSSGSVERSTQTSTGSWNSWSRAPIRSLMTVRDVPGRRFEILIYATSAGQNGQQGGYARVDVGADGTWDVAASHNAGTRNVRVPGVVPANGIVHIRLEIYGYAQSRDSSQPNYGCWTSATYQYPPRTKATFVQYGKSCGPTLSGASVDKATTHEISLTLSGAKRSQIGVLLIGDRRLDLAIPGSTCRFYAYAGLMLPFFTDLSGKAVRTLPTWSRYEPLLVRFQDILIEPGFKLVGSNGLELTIKK